MQHLIVCPQKKSDHSVISESGGRQRLKAVRTVHGDSPANPGVTTVNRLPVIHAQHYLVNFPPESIINLIDNVM